MESLCMCGSRMSVCVSGVAVGGLFFVYCIYI